jgi:hypothetical protein
MDKIKNIFYFRVMLDWYTIKYLYPSAFGRFSEVMFPNIGVESVSTLELFDIKKLYHFFDKEGIFLIIEMYSKTNWDYCISLSNGFSFGPSKETKRTREEIECDGFIECFRFLDKKISEVVV